MNKEFYLVRTLNKTYQELKFRKKNNETSSSGSQKVPEGVIYDNNDQELNKKQNWGGMGWAQAFGKWYDEYVNSLAFMDEIV